MVLIQLELHLIPARPDFEQLRTAIFFSLIHNFSHIYLAGLLDNKPDSSVYTQIQDFCAATDQT
jgi:hypothetical protein